MSGGLVDELHEVPLDRENQDLKEIIEIAFQITAQLEVENIAKNVAWSFASKFQPESVTFLLPGETEETPPRTVCYRGVKLEEVPPTADTLRAAFLTLVDQRGREAALALLAEEGVSRAGELKPDVYPRVLNKIHNLLRAN